MNETRRRWARWLVPIAIVIALWWLGVNRGFVGTPESDHWPAPSADVAPPQAEAPPALGNPALEEEPEEEPVEDGESIAAAELAPDAPVGSLGDTAPIRLLSGQVIELASGTPLPGFTIVITDETGRAARAESTTGGRFAVAWPRDTRGQVEVLPRPGWRDGLAARPLRAQELTGEDEILLPVAADARAIVHGRVVDEHTRIGVRALTLILHAPGDEGPRTLTTDRSGDFASPKPIASGTLIVEILDDSPEGRIEYGLQDIEHDAEADETAGHVIRVALGPTFEVETRTAEIDGRPAWKARIVERRGESDDAGTLVRVRAGWALSDSVFDVEEHAWSWRRLRSGEENEPAWFRYPGVEHAPELDMRAVLEVADQSETWVGDVRLESTTDAAGGQATRLVVEPRMVSRVLGTIRDVDGAPIPGARLWLRRAEGSALPGPWRADPDGAFTISGVPPGAYELNVTSPLRTELTIALNITRGENRLQPLTLPREDTAHAIRGGFVCEYDHGPGTVLLEVDADSGRNVARTVLRRVSSSRSKRAAASRFVIDDLVAGTFVLRPVEVLGEHHWTPDEVRVTTPAPDVVFRCLGRVTHGRVRVSARDKESGAPLSVVEVLLGPVRQEPFSWPESRPLERWYRWPRRSPLPWTVWSPGYQPRSGDEGDLGHSGSALDISVDLSRGFGARLVLREAPSSGAPNQSASPLAAWADRRPVPGVRIETDTAQAVGVTDEHGELLIRLDVEPDALRLRHSRWIAVGVEDVTQSAFQLPVIVVWMALRP